MLYFLSSLTNSRTIPAHPRESATGLRTDQPQAEAEGDPESTDFNSLDARVRGHDGGSGPGGFCLAESKHEISA
jgi:hypothetical protein